MAKRIAFVHDLPLGGAYVAMVHLLKGLKHLGHDIDLYTLPDNDPNVFADSISNLYHFSSPQPTRNYDSPLRRLTADLHALVIEPQIEKQLARDIDSRRYDLVLVTHTRFLDAPYVLRFLSTPSLYYTHGGPRTYYEPELKIPNHLPFYKYYYEFFLRKIKAAADRQNAQAATIIATTSDFAAGTISGWYGINPKTTGLGVDTAFFIPKRLPKKNQLLIVGNPEPQKAIDLAINALAEIKPAPRLVIASPRKFPTRALQSLADKHRLTLVWKTGQSSNEMRQLYRQSIATLALSHREHFGFSVVESLACGTPVIAVRDGAFPELVQNNRTGLLVNRDTHNVALAIEKLIGNPQLARKLGNNGRDWVTTHYRWSDATARLNEIINLL